MHNTEFIIKKILKDNPFSNLMNIIQIEELISTIPHMVFKVQDSRGKFYKLKKYELSEQIKKIESAIQLVPQFFPKFYGRDGNYLMFDFLQGRTLIENENLNIIYKMGRMCGEMNKYKFSNNYAINSAKNDYDELSRKKIKFFLKEKIITSMDYQRILRIYEKLKQGIEYDIVLDIYDISPTNFMIDSENKLYCIDEKTLSYFIKGFSFIRPFLYWFSKEQKKHFLNGYDSVNSSEFFHKDYERFVTLVYYVVKAFYKFKTGRDYSSELKGLIELK